MKKPKTQKTAGKAPLPSMAGSQFVVWWLAEDDYQGFEPSPGPNPLKVADYIWSEFCDRSGSPGRGRLWVPAHIPVEKLTCDPDDDRWIEYEDSGGIVIEVKDAPACALWGGRFTDLALNPIDFANVEARNGERQKPSESTTDDEK